jgi:hypothetical protein
MMARSRRLILALAISALCLVLVPTQALAGIIVTEGKISYCGVRLINVQELISLGLWHDDGECHEPGRSDGDSEDEASDDDYTDEDDLDIDEDDLGDLDATPDGYECDELAGGVEYCEPTGDSDDDEEASGESDGDSEDEGGQGAGPGAARGGAWTQGATPSDAAMGSEDQIAGCAAGGSAGDSLPAALVVCFALVAVVRRRFTA